LDLHCDSSHYTDHTYHLDLESTDWLKPKNSYGKVNATSRVSLIGYPCSCIVKKKNGDSNDK
jgi:hypothetical protein